jgi:uncharacterized Zn-finger protein
MFYEIKPGNSITITCGECDREYKLTYEPKATDMNEREKLGIDPAPFIFCPFCSNTSGFDIE